MGRAAASAGILNARAAAANRHPCQPGQRGRVGITAGLLMSAGPGVPFGQDRFDADRHRAVATFSLCRPRHVDGLERRDPGLAGLVARHAQDARLLHAAVRKFFRPLAPPIQEGDVAE